MDRQKVVKGVVGFGISVGLILYLYLTIEWHEVWVHIKEVSLLPIIPITGIYVIHYALRAIRWRLLLVGEEPISLRRLFDALILGNFATFVLPFRAGEFIRPLYLKKNSNHSFPACFVSVILERFFDLATVLLTFSYIGLIVPGLPEWAAKGAYILSVMAGGIFLFIFISTFAPTVAYRLLKFGLIFLPKILHEKVEHLVSELIGGAVVLKDVRRLVKIIVLTAIIWASSFLINYLYYSLFPVQANFLIGTTTGVILALAVAAPSAPGFLGVYEAACIAAGLLSGFSKEMLTAYAILSHVHQYILFVLYGGYVLLRDGLSLGKMQIEEKKLESQS